MDHRAYQLSISKPDLLKQINKSQKNLKEENVTKVLVVFF
jgi:hypothetical protein